MVDNETLSSNAEILRDIIFRVQQASCFYDYILLIIYVYEKYVNSYILK